MAITRVNVVSASVWSSATGTTLATAATAVTAGNTLIVAVSAVCAGGESVVSITDTAGNTYLKIDHVLPSDNFRKEMWYARNVTGHASNVVTVTWSGAVPYRGMGVIQYSGLDSVLPFDGATKVTGGTVTTITTPTLTTDRANSVHVLISRWGMVVSTITPTMTDISTDANIELWERTVGSPYVGTYAVTWTSATSPVSVMVASFTETAGTPATVPNVVGMTEAAAETALIAVSLVKGSVTSAYSPTVPIGDVISQNPAASTVVEAGSSVSLTVSLGSAPARLGQVSTEVLVLSDTPVPARLGQISVEVLTLGISTQPARVGQVSIEVLVLPDSTSGVGTGVWMGEVGGSVWVE